MNVTVEAFSKKDPIDAVPGKRSVCAVLTSFNRRALTLECLGALKASADLMGVSPHAVLMDDGSTDRTADAVRERFPWVTVLRGDGSLYWCRGMHAAFAAALGQGHDYYLWLNDDTILVPDALSRLFACEAALLEQDSTPPLLVGSTADATTNVISYGGSRRVSWLRPMRFELMQPHDEPQRCDAMTGNIVLVSASVAERLGNLDPIFEHAMGDTDYSMRALRNGITVWLAPGVYGSCSDNASAGTFRDESLSLHDRWERILDRKGLPWRSWLTLTRRHAGPFWPIHFAWPYAKTLLSGARHSLSSNRRRGMES